MRLQKALTAGSCADLRHDDPDRQEAQGERVQPTLTMNAEMTPSPGVELEKLLLVIQSGLRVRQRHQFFNWTQGPLQTLMPHDLLICAIAEGAGEGYITESISCYPQPQARKDALTRRDSLTLRLARVWERGGCEALTYDSDAASGPVAALSADLAPHDLGSMVIHGIASVHGGAGSFFGFCSMRGPVNGQHAFIAELLVPYLHSAWIRVLQRERLAAPPVLARRAENGVASVDAESLLTQRELEILHWMGEGKSNMEIGLILGISGLTVKNHVQNILRKLNVHNRTQAVSKCLSMNILRKAAE